MSAPSTEPSTAALLRDALVAARRAGKALRALFRTRPEGRVKTSARDLVTEADLAAERIILDYIESHYPDHGWLSEEAGRKERGASPYLWVVDPLDGTSNFAHGFPHFCVSIALLRDGRVLLGAIYDPIRGETFTAITGKGAWLNGRRLRVSGVATLERAMVSSGFIYEPRERRAATADVAARVIERVQMFRRSGSAALDLAYVAAGRTEAHWEFCLNLHDVAAGVLLVAEAGGKVEELRVPGWSTHETGYLGSNGTVIHGELANLFRRFLGPVEVSTPSLLEGRT